MSFDIAPNICSQCGLTWRGVHSCVADLQKRIGELETALRGLYSECCYAGHDTDSDYAWPAVMDQAKHALTPPSGGSEHG